MLNNIKSKIWGVVFLAFVPAFASAEFTISEYQYQKSLFPAEAQTGNFSFPIDAEIYAYGDQFFSDLRVVDQNYNELPYVIKKDFDVIKTETVNAKLKVVTKTGREYILDMGETPAYHQTIDVITNSFDFSRVVDIYGSNLPNTRFEKLTLDRQGELVAIVPGNKDTKIDFKYTNYRYIKLVFTGKEGEFVPTDFTIKKTTTEKTEGNKKISPLKMEVLDTEDAREQKMLFTVEGANTPVDSLVIHTSQKDFSRNIALYSSNDKNALLLEDTSRYDKNQTYWKKIYSGKFSEQVYSEEKSFSVNDNKKYYLAVVNNGDNAQLTITGATATQFLNSVYMHNLNFLDNTYTIFYGNIFAVKPKYDTTGFAAKISRENWKEVMLEEQKENILYITPAEKLADEKPYLIYISVAMLVAILFWFVYKIMRETSNKDGGEEVDIIEKL